MGPEVIAAMTSPAGIATLGGGALGMLGERQAQKERRRILNRSLDESAKTQAQATQAVQDEAKNFSPDARMAAMQGEEQRAYDQSQKDLAGAAPMETAASGAVSGDFLRGQADKALTEGNRLTAIARELARVRAPGSLLMNEGMRRANTMGNVNSMWSSARSRADARRLDAEDVESPWWGQLGRLASMAGRAYMGAK